MEMNMKNLIKSTVGLVLGCVVLLTAMTAWAVKPVKYVAEPISVTDMPMLDCSWFDMDFLVLGDWIINEYGQEHWDKEGNLVKISGFLYTTEQHVWNSTDPAKYLLGEDAAGKTEHSHFILNFDENGVPTQYMESGVYTKIIVPGYGQIMLHAGHGVYLLGSGGWTQVHATPKTGLSIADAYALCTYLE